MVTALLAIAGLLVLAAVALIATVFSRMVAYWLSENAQVARSDRQYNEFISEWARRRNQR